MNLKNNLIILLLPLCFLIELFPQTVEFGGQIRLRREIEENFLLDSASAGIYKYRDFRQRSRLHTLLRMEKVVLFFEIENNSRWGLRTNTPNTSKDEQQLDEAGEIYINNVFIDLPVPFISNYFENNIRIGRQYFILGEGLIIDRNSDDAPDVYDGIKWTVNFNEVLNSQFLFIQDFLARPTRSNRKTDQRGNRTLYGVILNYIIPNNAFTNLISFSPYFTLQSNNEKRPAATSEKIFYGIYSEGQLPKFLNVLGIDRTKFKSEFALQRGHKMLSKEKINYNGMAFYVDLNTRWMLKGGIELKLKGLYHYGTGDDLSTKDDETFRSDYQNYRPGELFGEERIGSNFYDGLYGDERIGRGGTNIQIYRISGEIEWREFSFEAEYFHYTAAKVPNNVSNSMGEEIDLSLKYIFNKNLEAGIKAARFYPGNFFGRNIEPANKVQMELKLTF